ncbi:hypothetical protein SUGI_0424300 [Cryptomeria japonica]|nr:hypothetical protein SUGI_0424300 [Cryptomeria japonica]
MTDTPSHVLAASANTLNLVQLIVCKLKELIPPNYWLFFRELQSLQRSFRQMLIDSELVRLRLLPSGIILKRDATFRQLAHLKSDYEATSLRLKTLKEEFNTMKKKLKENKRSQKKIETLDLVGCQKALELLA